MQGCCILCLMNTVDTAHSESLRRALNAMHHSGPEGFEGLLAIVLAKLTGQSFRLARSGTQRGRDGDSAFDGGETMFEGKRYESSPGKSEIAAKLVDLATDNDGQVDLWVLGATCEVAAQTVTDARAFAAMHGIGIATLDWSNTSIGSLLVAIVASGDDAKTFITDALAKQSQTHLIPTAVEAIDHFTAHADLAARLDAVRKGMSAEEAGLGNAKALNRSWIHPIFKSRRLARAEFGQPLAPLDASGMLAVPRPQQASLLGAFTGKPASEFYVMLGDEGVGKSWICANTWLSASPASILVICPAEELVAPEATADFELFLIERLIHQSGWHNSERAVERWRRRIKGWRANPTPDNVRVTLVVDGLNQPRKVDWSRWLDRAAAELKAIGGCLVVSTRTAHWSQLKGSITSKVTPVTVPLWTIDEVKTLLSARKIDEAKVSADVLQSLRNPRLFGIAVDLLEAKDVETIGQLTVGRLIFEHMRKAHSTGAIPTGVEFANLLRGLAAEVIARIEMQVEDDLRIFDSAQREELNAVASSRFFEGVPGSPLEYQIKQEGLDLGLALYLVSALEKEQRNGRNPYNSLGTLLEPIGALDEVAKVVFLAMQVAFLQDDSTDPVRIALVEHFLSLQNLPTDNADAFASLLRACPAAFLSATERIYTSSERHNNVDWLLHALLAQRDDPSVWAEFKDHAKRWLSIYSLAPERRMFESSRDVAKAETERTKRLAEIKERVDNLTAIERAYVANNLTLFDRWDFESLLKATFFVLAGKPLAEFAPYFVRWSFADSYWPIIHAADKEFRRLIRFNRVDWAETRAALLNEIEALPENDTSDIGKWTRVEILRATGDVGDAQTAETLALWLVRNREKFEGWSRIAQYCENDPCDPSSAKPDNVDNTAAEYRAIDPALLNNGMGHSEKDHFFNMARCGVARFHLSDAIATHRALADHVLTRADLPRRQGVLEVLEHSSLLTAKQAQSFLEAGQLSEASYKKDNSGNDEWLTAQYSVQLAIPHFPADEQLEAISNIRGDTVLLDTVEELEPASGEQVERVLEKVVQSGSADAQASVLCAIAYSKPKLSPRAVSTIARLVTSDSSLIRGQALGAAARSGSTELIKAVCVGGWDARPLKSEKKTFERWYGSSVLLQGAKQNFIAVDEALERMHLDHYGFVAIELGSVGAAAVVPRIDAALVMALGYTAQPGLPDMATNTPKSTDPRPPLISLNDPPPQTQQEQWDRVGETSAEFDERQARVNRAYEEFAKELSSSDANLVLADLTFRGVEAAIEENPDAGNRWLAMLSAAPDYQLRHLHNFAVQVALAMAVRDVGSAADFLERVLSLRPTINRVSGAAKISSERLLLWGNTDTPRIETICRRRLVSRESDADMAVEVLAALLQGKSSIVSAVIDDRLASGHPADICLALTLAGYSDESDEVFDVISRFDGTQGFVGEAQRAAKAAYERNSWARVWHRQAREATDPHVFWQGSVLLAKIVDLRFDLWSDNLGAEGTIYRAFAGTIERNIARRIEKWQKARAKKLYGDDAPEDVFFAN